MNWKLRYVTSTSSKRQKQEVCRFSVGNYLWATQSRLEVPWGDETYGLVAAFAGTRCIGTTSCTVSPRKQGILSQVFTDPGWRGQGIASAVVREAVETFRTHRARAVYLGSGQEWVRQMYRKVGFQFIGAMERRHAFKLTLDPSGEDAVLFRPGQRTEIRPLRPDDQADLSALFNARHPCVVKHHGLGCYLGSHFEGEFFTLRQQADQPGFRALVLDGRETVLGLGTVLPSPRRHQGHRGLLDLLVHPDYAAEAPELLERLETACGLDALTAYVEDSEAGKRRLFERAGYREIAQLRAWIKIGTAPYNLTLYEKTLS